MTFQKTVEYKGRTYTVDVQSKSTGEKVMIDHVECKPVIMRFPELPHCFVTRAVLSDEDVIVIIYRRNVYIKACPKGEFQAYSKTHFSSAFGNRLIGYLALALTAAPMAGLIVYFMEYIGGFWVLPCAAMLLLYLFPSQYLLYHPGMGRVKRLLIWLVWALATNALAFAYGVPIIKIALGQM